MSCRVATPLLFAVCVLCCPMVSSGASQSATQKKHSSQPSDPIPRSDSDRESNSDVGDGESSSKQTQIDISPPKDDAATHAGSDISDVTEMHTWNPHKAEKNLEVGEFYEKRKNY